MKRFLSYLFVVSVVASILTFFFFADWIIFYKIQEEQALTWPQMIEIALQAPPAAIIVMHLLIVSCKVLLKACELAGGAFNLVGSDLLKFRQDLADNKKDTASAVPEVQKKKKFSNHKPKTF